MDKKINPFSYHDPLWIIKSTPITCIKQMSAWLKTIITTWPKIYDQKEKKKWTILSLSLVCAASEFIFSNISDLIKSAAVFSSEPWHCWLLYRVKPRIKRLWIIQRILISLNNARCNLWKPITLNSFTVSVRYTVEICIIGRADLAT